MIEYEAQLKANDITDGSEFRSDGFLLIGRFVGCAGHRNHYVATLTDTETKPEPMFVDFPFSPAPARNNDKMAVLEAALAGMCLGPDDVDEEFFKDETEEQMSWRSNSRCLDLDMIRSDIAETYNLE